MSKPAKITFTKFDGLVREGCDIEARIMRGAEEIGTIGGVVGDDGFYSRTYTVKRYEVALTNGKRETFRVTASGKNPMTSREALSAAKAWARANA